MAPHGTELPLKMRERIISSHKDGKSCRKIGELLKMSFITFKAIVVKHKTARMKCAKDHQHESEAYWKNVLWSEKQIFWF